MSLLRPLAGALACHLVLAAADAHGEGPAARPSRTARLVFEEAGGGKQCIDEAALRAAVERRLGRRVFVGPGEKAEALVKVRVEGSPRIDEWHVEILVANDDQLGQAGHRRLAIRTSNCDDIREALALIVTVTLDHDAPPAPTAPSRGSQLGQPPAAPGAQWAVVMGLGASSGALPHLGVRAVLGAEVQVGRWPRVGFNLRGGLPQDVAAPGAAIARFTRAGIEASLCPRLHYTAHTAIRACGGLALDALAARGRGFDADHNDLRLVPSVVAGVNFEVSPARNWFARLTAGCEFPLARRSYAFSDGVGNSVGLFSPPSAQPLLLMGIGWRAPNSR